MSGQYWGRGAGGGGRGAWGFSRPRKTKEPVEERGERVEDGTPRAREVCVGVPVEVDKDKVRLYRGGGGGGGAPARQRVSASARRRAEGLLDSHRLRLRSDQQRRWENLRVCCQREVLSLSLAPGVGATAPHLRLRESQRDAIL